MDPILRLFAAIPIPDEHKKEIDAWTRRIRATSAFRTWVHPQDLHLTIKFLGQVPAAHVPRVEEVLARIATQAAGFHLHIEGLGTFGRKNQPSVLWAGIHGEVNKLTWFQQVVENELEQIGFESEKRSFKPHLTLARNYQGQGDWDETQLIQSGSLNQDYSRWFADRITLYRSQLGQKPMYEPLAEYLFTGKS